MSRKSITKDERFLLELYRFIKNSEVQEIQTEEIVRHLALSSSTARNIINLLAQTGFIRYTRKDGRISLTQKGISLCQDFDKIG